MTTSTTTNYGWTIPNDDELVKNGAAAIRTLGQAIDTTAATSFGGDLILINTTSFSAVSSVNVNNVFSATYDNYKLLFNNITGIDWVGIRLRASGTDDSGANYRQQSNTSSGTGNTASRQVNQTSWANVIELSGAGYSSGLEIANPFLTTTTMAGHITGGAMAGNPVLYLIDYGLNTSTSYDGFSLIPASGTITGSISTYGYVKA